MSEIDMGIFLPLMSNYRNLCAHEDILYDHKTQRVIPNNKYHEKLNIPREADEYIYGKNDLFALLIMLKYMLRDEEFRLLAYEIGYEIDLLDGKVNSIPLNKILEKLGFPPNWKDIVEM
jgi:abortive infection bacteriophage resistance protein